MPPRDRQFESVRRGQFLANGGMTVARGRLPAPRVYEPDQRLVAAPRDYRFLKYLATGRTV
jgi:hypothetical protein